jgi:hypothetical protein
MANNMDYKFVLQDTMRVYIGAKYTVREIEEDDRIPVKLIASIRKVIKLEENEDIALDTHFYNLKKEEIAYIMWKQLKISMKFQNLQPEIKRGKEIYQSESVSFEEGLKKIQEDPNQKKWYLTEIQFAKMRLAMLGI